MVIPLNPKECHSKLDSGHHFKRVKQMRRQAPQIHTTRTMVSYLCMYKDQSLFGKFCNVNVIEIQNFYHIQNMYDNN